MSNKGLISVCMITYNHEHFIREAIEGVLMQKTDFPIELIIGEDCSTDGTRDIVLEYAAKYPDIIRPLLPEKNLGVKTNFFNTLKLCKGEYIALCEGDDYWIEKHKLQIQVEYLNLNKQCSLVHTNGFWKKGNKTTPWQEYETLSGKVEETFYYGNIVRTCTALLRKEFLEEFLEISKKMEANIICDWPLFAFYAKKGEFGYIEKQTSIYRLNNNSVTSRKNAISALNYALDVAKMKRFLRDYLFPKKLDILYSEKNLIGDINHAIIKKYFRLYEYKDAKLFFNNTDINKKSLKLKKYTSNILIFYLACIIKNTIYNK